MLLLLPFNKLCSAISSLYVVKIFAKFQTEVTKQGSVNETFELFPLSKKKYDGTQAAKCYC
jgi:hypothetical protein